MCAITCKSAIAGSSSAGILRSSEVGSSSSRGKANGLFAVYEGRFCRYSGSLSSDRCRLATDNTKGSLEVAGGGGVALSAAASGLSFWSLDERPCSHNVMGTASTNGTVLDWPTERAPRKSIHSGSILTHQTSRGSDQSEYRDSRVCAAVGGLVNAAVVGVLAVFGVGVEEPSEARSVAGWCEWQKVELHLIRSRRIDLTHRPHAPKSDRWPRTGRRL